MKKVFVDAIIKFTTDGQVIPQCIIWENGQRFEIDKIQAVSQAASVVGGQGIRYTCKIMGKEKYLWLEDGRWFVEGK